MILLQKICLFELNWLMTCVINIKKFNSIDQNQVTLISMKSYLGSFCLHREGKQIVIRLFFYQ